MAESLHNIPMVIDNGSGTIRAGFAGEELPKCYFPSFVGRPKHLRVLAGALEGDWFVGPRAATELRGLLKINYPLEHGIVTDWDDMEKIWAYIYDEGLKVLSEEHPVLLTEPPLNPRSNRDTAAQILFETFNVPALYTSIQAVLSLYASGRTTGIVLDAGDGVSHAVPVYEGFAITNSIQRIDVAGRDVTEYLQTLLRKSGYVFHTSAEKEVVRHIKEATSYIALDPKKEEKDFMTAKSDPKRTAEFILPDGNKLKVSLFFSGPYCFIIIILLLLLPLLLLPSSPLPCTPAHTHAHRLAPNASERPRSCLSPNSSGWSTPACTRWWWTASCGRTWICASRCMPTLCCRAARH